NEVSKMEVRPRSVIEPFVLLLAPFAPHLAEELWQALGHQQSLAYEPWPKYDPELVKADAIEVPGQVGGKGRARLMVPAEIDDAALKELALADEAVRKHIDGKRVTRVVIAAKGSKLVNIVVAG